MNLSIQQIHIEGVDLRRFGWIAFLLDKEEVILEIAYVRTFLKLTKLYKRKEVKTLVDAYKYYPKNKKIAIELDGADLKERFKKREPTKFEREYLAWQATVGIAKKYNAGLHFHRVIFYAILCGEVNTTDLPDAIGLYTIQQFKDEMPQYYSPYDTVLIIKPFTSMETIKKYYDHYQKALGVPDTMTNIKRDRTWYWWHKTGMSYSAIHTEILKRNEKISEDGVKKAIKRYKKLAERGGYLQPKVLSWTVDSHSHISTSKKN